MAEQSCFVCAIVTLSPRYVGILIEADLTPCEGIEYLWGAVVIMDSKMIC